MIVCCKVSTKGGSSAKKTPVRRFGERSPNVSNISAQSGEQTFFTPTGTIEISQELDKSTTSEHQQRLSCSADFSLDIMHAINTRRMTVDAATVLDIIGDLEKAQTALRSV